MTEGLQSLRADVAYMRGLAEEGRRAPLLGGSISVAAGLIYGAASLGHYAVVTDRIGEGPTWSLLAIWLGAGAVMGLAVWLLTPATRDRPGAASAGNKAASLAWMSIGWSIGAVFLAFFVAASRTGEWVIMDLLLSVALAFYGAAWGVSAGMSGARWLWLVSLGSLASAVGLAFLVGRPELYLAFAAGLLFWAVAPGLLMMRQAAEQRGEASA
jgi:hypothetical protein